MWFVVSLHILLFRVTDQIRSPLDDKQLVLENLVLEKPVEVRASRTCRSTGERGAFVLKPELNFRLPLGVSFFAGQNCTREVPVRVVPWLDSVNPINGSQIFVYLAAFKLERRPNANGLEVCSHSELGTTFICQLEPSPEREGMSAFLRHVPGVTEQQLESLRELEVKCPSGLTDFMLVALLLSLLLVVLVTVDLLWDLKSKEPSCEPQDVKVESESVKSADALVMPKPINIFKDGALQVLRFATLTISLQAVVLNKIKLEASSRTVFFAVFWPCTFGFAGTIRILQTTCQVLLSQAALSHGVCLTKPAKALRYDYFTGLGTLVLVCCVGWALASLGLYALLVLLVGLFAGPALSIASEVQKAWGQENAIAEAEGSHKLLGLRVLFHDKDSVKTTLLEEMLAQGTVKAVPFSAVVFAGRRNNDIMQALAGPAEGTEGTGSFNLVRDVRWQRRVVRQLTGSTAGFWILPVLAAAAAVMLGSTADKMVFYLCSQPALTQLSLASAEELRFDSWGPRFAVQLDASHKQVYLQAAAAESITRSVWIEERPAIFPQRSSTLKSVSIHQQVPQEVKLGVAGLRATEANYSIMFSPAATFPSSIKISVNSDSHARPYDYCMPWGEIPGAVISIPTLDPDLPLRMEVFLTDFEVGVPLPCQHSLSQTNSTYSTFCFKEELPRSRDSAKLLDACQVNNDPHACQVLCLEICQRKPQCLAAFPATAGCYFAEKLGTTECSGADHQHRHWLNRTVSGELCQVASSLNCIQASQTNRWSLVFELVPIWLDRKADLKLFLYLSQGDEALASVSETLHLRDGLDAPAPLDVLVAVRAWNGTGEEPVESHVALQADGSVEVTLSRFDPVRDVWMYIAPLVNDPQYVVDWPPEQLVEEVYGPHDLIFAECKYSDFLRERFQLCGNRLGSGWPTNVGKVLLPQFAPEELTAAYFQLKGRDELREEHYAPRNIRVKLQGVRHASEWVTSPQSPCSMSLDVADPHTTAVNSIAVSAGLWCTFINQGCSEVSLTTHTTNQTILLEKYLSGVGMRSALQKLHEPDSSQEFTRLTAGWRVDADFLMKVLHCAWRAGRANSMGWMSTADWQPCQGSKHGPTSLCSRSLQEIFPPGQGELNVKELLKVMQGGYNPWVLHSFLSGGTPLDADLLARTCSKFDRASPSLAVERMAALLSTAARFQSCEVTLLLLRECLSKLHFTRSNMLQIATALWVVVSEEDAGRAAVHMQAFLWHPLLAEVLADSVANLGCVPCAKLVASQWQEVVMRTGALAPSHLHRPRACNFDFSDALKMHAALEIAPATRCKSATVTSYGTWRTTQQLQLGLAVEKLLRALGQDMGRTSKNAQRQVLEEIYLVNLFPKNFEAAATVANLVLPAVHTIRIRRSANAAAGLRALLQGAIYPKLEKICLGEQRMSGDELEQALSGRELRRLRLEMLELGETGAVHLGRLLAKMPSLQQLDVIESGISDAGLDAFCGAVRQGSGLGLRGLDLTENPLGQSKGGGLALAKLLSAVPLEKLRLPTLSETFLEELATAQISSLQDVAIRTQSFSSLDATRLKQLLLRNPRLRRFNLASLAFSEGSLGHICQA
ncbi:unnamed protein product, partial [Effrenium voratum]